MGSLIPVASCDFANARPKVLSIPITSPVDFISGPRRTSTSVNLLNGKTDSFTAIWTGLISFVNPISFKVLPAMIRAAIFARGTPIVLLTNGIVREARGFTSIIYISPFCTANWILIRPITLSSFARAIV